MTSTSTGSSRRSDDYCYRHPDRQSFVLCQRCLRTVCAECQTPMPVGVICPECLREQRAAQPAAARAPRRLGRYATVPVVTYSVIALSVLVFLADLASGGVVANLLAFASVFVDPGSGYPFQPWRLVTVLLVHSGWLHLGLNMLVLFLMGRGLEPLLGHARFLALYLLSGLGGSVAVALLAPGVPVVGASGAIFGLFGSMLIIGRHLGVSIRSIAILIAINFALPFVFALIASLSSGSFSSALDAVRISWQAHLGGLVTGVGIGLIFARTRAARRQRLQTALLVGVGAVLLALLAVPALLAG